MKAIDARYCEAKFIGFFGGWLAFRHGRTIRRIDKRIRVFSTEAEALAAAAKSKRQFGTR